MSLKLLLLSALCSITYYGLHSFGLLVLKYCVSVKAFSACQLGKCVTYFCLIYFIKEKLLIRSILIKLMPFNLRTFQLAPKTVCLKSRLFADIKMLVQKISFVLSNHYSLLTFNLND